MNRYYWSGISFDDRVKAIADIKNIVFPFATILNFQRSSDISISLFLEADEKSLDELFRQLKTVIVFEKEELDFITSDKNCLVYLYITFSKGTGELEIEIPEYPE